jgi:hypothetical protein
LQLGAYRTEALWICKQLTTTRKVNLLLPAERTNVKYGSRIIGMLGHSALYMLFSICTTSKRASTCLRSNQSEHDKVLLFFFWRNTTLSWINHMYKFHFVLKI